MLNELRDIVCSANLELVKQDLVIYSFGNVSGIDREQGIVVIKASGVPYDRMTAEHMVPVELATGRVLAGDLRPSSDTPTHLELYRSFAVLGGVCHTHSKFGTAWAQAQRGVPCLGTTHADHYYGDVPVTPPLTESEVADEYELNTGKAIVRHYHDQQIDPAHMPAVLVANHGPFTWGPNPHKAVENAKVLEQCAEMAWVTFALNPQQAAIPAYLLDKHYLRKHGANAYYGQK